MILLMTLFFVPSFLLLEGSLLIDGNSEVYEVEGEGPLTEFVNEEKELPPLEIHFINMEDMSESQIIKMIGEDDGTIEWRAQLWQVSEVYPDNIGYIMIDEDQMTYIIGLVDNSEEKQEEIRALVPHSENIRFEQATYSHNELVAVQEEITQEWLANDWPIHGIGVGVSVDEENINGFGPTGNETRVVVYVDSESVERFEALFNEQYGDLVYVEHSKGFTVGELEMHFEEDTILELEESEIYTNPKSKVISGEYESSNESAMDGEYSLVNDEAALNKPDWFFQTLLITAGMAMVFLLYYLFQKGRVQLRQLVGGSTIQENTVFSRKEVKSLVKESTYEPDSETYYNILDKL